MDAATTFRAAGLGPDDLQALRDLWAEYSPLPDRERAAIRALLRAVTSYERQTERTQAQRLAALALIANTNPGDDPGRIAVLFGHLRLILAERTDLPLDVTTRHALWDVLVGDDAYAQLVGQAPGN